MSWSCDLQLGLRFIKKRFDRFLIFLFKRRIFRSCMWTKCKRYPIVRQTWDKKFVLNLPLRDSQSSDFNNLFQLCKSESTIDFIWYATLCMTSALCIRHMSSMHFRSEVCVIWIHGSKTWNNDFKCSCKKSAPWIFLLGLWKMLINVLYQTKAVKKWLQ